MELLGVLFLMAFASTSWAMTVSLKEADALPEELRPIMPGGSWFDDMAVKRLHMKHHELKEMGKLDDHKHDEDEEEMFIMAKLGSSHNIHVLPEVGTPVTLPVNEKPDHREVMRNFLRHNTPHSSEHHDHDHDHDHDDDNNSKGHDASSHEFMEIYERELENFFENFMSAMLQAEVGGDTTEES